MQARPRNGRIKDNRIAELAQIVDDLLTKLLAELDYSDFDMDLFGFADTQTNHLIEIISFFYCRPTATAEKVDAGLMDTVKNNIIFEN